MIEKKLSIGMEKYTNEIKTRVKKVYNNLVLFY